VGAAGVALIAMSATPAAVLWFAANAALKRRTTRPAGYTNSEIDLATHSFQS